MRRSGIAISGLLAGLFLAQPHAASAIEGSDEWPAVERARALAASLAEHPERLALRHHHQRVIRAWSRAITKATSEAERAAARRGEAEAWALLAHWSGLSSDRAKAKALSEPSVVAAEVRPDTDPVLAAIVADVRRSYPEVHVQPEPAKPKVVSTKAPLVVVIDPGHGGRDRGASGVKGIKEKNINLAMAAELGRRLEHLGARVIYTRQKDRFVSLRTRIRRANRAKADLFISLHANAHSKDGVRGVETYFWAGAQRRGSASWRLAKLVQGHMVSSLERRHSRIRNLGTKPARFKVLRGVRMPAVLIEAGFVTDTLEAGRLRDRGYRRDLVDGIARAVAAFLNERSTPAVAKFRAEPRETPGGDG